jgi:uncharacterized damage-inducible protein DinB
MAKLNHSLLTRNVEGLSDEQALVTLVQGGNHMNWLVAHLVTSRDEMLEVLGAERVRTKEVDDRFDFGKPPPSPEEALPLDQLVADYQTTQDRLLAALEPLTAEQLAQPHGKRDLEYQLTFMLWHEAYHVGQATLYRRKAGLKSPIG